MRKDSGYVPVESGPPLKGLATSFPSNKLNPAYSPRLLNCVIRDGVVRRRAGGPQLGRRLVGKVLSILEFGELGEDPFFVVLTSKRQYLYNPADEDWQDLTADQIEYPITSVSVSSKTFTISGDHTSEFTATQEFAVVGGANRGAYTTVSSSFGGGLTVITVAEAPVSAVVAGDIVLADDLDSDPTDFISWVSITDLQGHRLLFTNGRDKPRVWDGTLTGRFGDWDPTFTGFETCKTLCVYGEHLFMGGVTTSDFEPLTIAWSDAGDFDNFEAGTSGVQVLYELQTGIRWMKVLGDRLVIYSTDAIAMGLSVGPPAIFAFETIIPEGTRLVSPQVITSINVGHIYVSEENIYLFDGSRGLRVLGDNIYTGYKETKNHELLYISAALNDYSKRTLYFSVPDINGGTMIYTAYYDLFNLAEMTWGQEKYADTVTAWGFFVNRDEALTWEDASWEETNMPWSEELGAWLEEGETLNFPMRAYGTDDGRVVIVSEGVLSDRGVAPQQTYETVDFEVPEVGESNLGRWGEIEFEAWGSQVNVIVSKSQGRGYQGIQTVPLTEQPTTYRLPIDISSRTLRVKFTATSNYSLKWVRLWVRPGGPR